MINAKKVAFARTNITERSIYLTTELYTPQNQKVVKKRADNQNRSNIIFGLIVSVSISLIKTTKKIAKDIEIKSLSIANNFLFNLEVSSKDFFRFIY